MQQKHHRILNKLSGNKSGHGTLTEIWIPMQDSGLSAIAKLIRVIIGIKMTSYHNCYCGVS